MADREPLSQAERDHLSYLLKDGYEGHIGDHTPEFGVFVHDDEHPAPEKRGQQFWPEVGIHSYPHEAKVWAVISGEEPGLAAPLTPDQARRYAMGLLAAADHAEFGPGEWRRAGEPLNGDVWVPMEPPAQ